MSPFAGPAGGLRPSLTAEFTVEQRPEAGYRALLRSGELRRRVESAVAELAECRACPRDCRVDRLHAVPPHDTAHTGSRTEAASRHTAGRAVPPYVPKGTSCFTGRFARVSSAFPHLGEEACLRGWNGSGTIFFSFCNLRCVFCQNWDVSQRGEGDELRPGDLAAVMLALQARGCHNINWVTPEHVVPQALEALLLAAEAGLRLPIVYNTSAYDSPRSLQLLDGVVDIYMPDFKYWSPDLARRHLKAADYPEVARSTLREMHRQVGPLLFDRDGLAVRGVLLRHLVMPGCGEDAGKIFEFVAAEVSRDTFVNIMGQYHPAGAVAGHKYPELCRCPAAGEVELAVGRARSLGLWRLVC